MSYQKSTSFGSTTNGSSKRSSPMLVFHEMCGSSIGGMIGSSSQAPSFIYGEKGSSLSPGISIARNPSLSRLRESSWRISDPTGFTYNLHSEKPSGPLISSTNTYPERCKSPVPSRFGGFSERPVSPMATSPISSRSSSILDLTNYGSGSSTIPAITRAHFTSTYGNNLSVPNSPSLQRKPLSRAGSSSSLQSLGEMMSRPSLSSTFYLSSSSCISGSSIYSNNHFSSMDSYRPQLRQRPIITSCRPSVKFQEHNTHNFLHRRDHVIKFRERQKMAHGSNSPISWKLPTPTASPMVSRRRPDLRQLGSECSRSFDSGIGSPEKKSSFYSKSQEGSNKWSSVEKQSEKRLFTEIKKPVKADICQECKVNCHHKCEKHVPNLCGVNQKVLSEIQETVKKDISTPPPSPVPQKVYETETNKEISVTETAAPPSPPNSDSDEGFVQQTERENGISEVKEQPQKVEVQTPQAKRPSGIDVRSLQKPPRIRFKKYNIEDFNFMNVLGKGSFGKVLLAELKGHGKFFAIKCLKKDVVLEDDDVESTVIERKMLVLGNRHPFLCKLFCTFQTESHLFFAMEYLNGGDLMFQIQQSGKFDQDRARFYAAEIVIVLTFMHKNGIIYRDLKLDNVLLDCEGHIRLIDFGMCQLRTYREECLPSNFCGTPEYMAPEIIKGLQYNQSVDWWSFGVMLYEMLTGQSPFNGTDEDELFWSVCNEEAYYPRFLSKEAKQIITLLLEKDPYKRLGMPKCSAGNIRFQPFFNAVDWERMERRQVAPPFKPSLSGPSDTSNFDSNFTMEKAVLTPIDSQFLASMDQQQFKGFSYTNPDMTD